MHQPKHRSLKSLQQQSETARRIPKAAVIAGTWHPGRVKTCQWIEGEPRGRDFCGAPVLGGSPYCEAHHRRCYRVLTVSEK